VLRAAVTGTVVAGEHRWDLDGATAYAEKNWGHGFPARWWWGEAHDFDGDPVTVAFAGGSVLGGPAARLPGAARVEATALVVAIDGRLVRLGEPLLGPVRAATAPGEWRLRGRTLRHRIEVEAAADPAAAHLLDVPAPKERRTERWSHHHVSGGRLHVRVTRRGRTLYEGESRAAGLEEGRADAPSSPCSASRSFMVVLDVTIVAAAAIVGRTRRNLSRPWTRTRSSSSTARSPRT
jgi:hypothetical protein